MRAEEEIKEVCTAFGAVAFAAQAFERQLAIALATALASGATVKTRQQYDDLLHTYFHKTAGQLSQLVKGDEVSLVELKAEIERAVRQRNFFMHNYFWERAVQFTSSEGRERMVNELYDASSQFEALDNRLTALTKAWASQRGVTEEDHLAAQEEILRGESYPH